MLDLVTEPEVADFSAPPPLPLPAPSPVCPPDAAPEVPSLAAPEGRTDLANARRLAKRYGKDFRWCQADNRFRTWDGQRWAVDDCLKVEGFAKQVAQRNFAEAASLEPDKALDAFLKASASATGIRSMLRLVRSEPGIALPMSAFDQHPTQLNLRNGTLDLADGRLRPHEQLDYLTTLAPVDYDESATCPVWSGFVEQVFGGQTELIQYVQQAAGYCLGGDVSEHVLFVCHGDGANGKSTFLNTLMGVLGTDYAMKASKDLLLTSGAHPTELTDLCGKRFVACIETGKDRKLAETLVKEMTGGDSIRARRMRQDYWEFRPTHKLWLATNYLPQIRGRDKGIWRRIRLIPFRQTFSEADQDKRLSEKLRSEYPGILNWLLAGRLAWAKTGSLTTPEAVSIATTAYQIEMNVLEGFLQAACVLDPNQECKASQLYSSFRMWCQECGKPIASQRAFGIALSCRGFQRRSSNGTMYRGIGLRSPLPGTLEGSGTNF